jgi:hypothetical protein
MLNNFSLVLILVSFTLTPIFAQVSKDSKDSKVAASQPKDASEKKEEGKPVKMETGTVTLDPAAVSSDLKKINMKHLKKLRSSFLNYGGEEKFKALTKDYVDASIKFQERNYISSRRLFEQNNLDINAEAEKFSKTYTELYSKLYSEASTQLVDFKINSADEDSISPSLEKNLVTANEFWTMGQTFASKKNHVDALYEYKNAIQNVFRVFSTISKFKNRKLTTQEKFQANLLIEDDFIQKEQLKEYDDSQNLIFVQREKEREKEREQVKKGITNKYGEIKNAPAKTDKADEPKKDTKTTPAEPAKK